MSDEQAKLLLLGVGGGGGRLAAAIRTHYQGEMRVVCMDTDALATREIQQMALDIPCILFGGGRLAGNGTAGDTVQGGEAFKDDAEQLLEPHLQGVRTVVILACLGAGTGGGATPKIANLLKQKGISTLCIVTRPFSFEGQARQAAANLGCSQIATHANAIAEIPLDDLFEEGGQATLTAAIESANRVLARGVALLWRMVSRPGCLINVDPERLHNLIMHGGETHFGSAVATGDGRVGQLMGMLKGSRLLRASETLDRARTILVGILGGEDLRLTEIGDIKKQLGKWHRAECRVEIGTVLDPEFDGRIELVVFTFENWAGSGASAEPPILELGAVKSSKQKKKESPRLPETTGAEPNVWRGQNLDEPTFRRLDIQLDR